MKKLRTLLFLTTVLIFGATCAFGASGDNYDDMFRPGLAGAQYDDGEFTEVDEDGNILHSLDQNWASALGNDWRAAWHGYIEGPYTGNVTISAEFEDGMELLIDNKVVIDGIGRRLRNKMSCTVKMTRGKKVPIAIKFVTFNSKALLRLKWQWEGSKKVVIPGEALSFQLSSLPPALKFEFDYIGLENALNWNLYAPARAPLPAGQIDVSTAKIVVLQKGNKVLDNGADMLADEILKRARIDVPTVKTVKKSDICFVIGTKDDLANNNVSLPAGLDVPQKKDGYAFWVDNSSKAAKVYMIGYDKRGALFAVGRLLRLLDMGRDWAYLDSDVRIATAPKYSLRGHQLGYRPKTHSYDGWDIEMWEQYYRDLIVFGTNAVELIPPTSDDDEDSPHFPKDKLEMMVLMSQLAADYGLDVWIWFTALDKRDGKRVDYSDEATIKESLAEWAEVFESLPKIDDVFVPGGDPGNTHPAILLPFMEKQKKLLNKYHPKARMWVSPQNFDRNGKDTAGWYKAFVDIMQNEQPKWLDGVVFGPTVPVSLPDLRKDMPSQYLIRRYPDITHTRSCPYSVQDWDKALNDTQGREAINPRPVAYAQIFRATADKAIGFVSYSEGCNDDFNKMLWSALGWDPDTKVEDIVSDFSRYFINQRFDEKFAKGLFALEKNWVGPLYKNKGVDETLALFQEMEKEATPHDSLNWRFQQALYRVYYDAYIKAKLIYEMNLEADAMAILKKAGQLGSLTAMEKTEALLKKDITSEVAPELRLKVFVLAEALFQSIRMQHSVEKYHSQRYANLDDIDEPLTRRKKVVDKFEDIRKLTSEQERLAKISELTDDYSERLKKYMSKQVPANWPDWTVEFDKYQRKRSGLFKPFSDN